MTDSNVFVFTALQCKFYRRFTPEQKCWQKRNMMPHIYAVIVLLCLHISVQQFSVNGVALENSIDSHDDHFNVMLESSYSTTANYNSSNLLGLPNLFDSFSTFFGGKSNKPVSKMCNLNTVSDEYCVLVVGKMCFSAVNLDQLFSRHKKRFLKRRTFEESFVNWDSKVQRSKVTVRKPLI